MQFTNMRNVKIRQLKKTDTKDIGELFNQLVKKPEDFNYFSELDIQPIIDDPNCHCVVLEYNRKAIGFAAIVIFRTPVYGLKGRIEDVVIHNDYRGKGLGRLISQELIKIAKKKKIKNIHLTSKPDRIPARKLYESLGFKMKDTGVFVLNL